MFWFSYLISRPKFGMTAKLVQTGDARGVYFPEKHYEAAFDNREIILQFGDTRSLTYLMLLGQHCLRMPKDPGPW
jgi:hypothetical protein